MTIKDQLEILRGEPIHVWTGDPLKIPCIETSDSEKLCKHPVVSVNMITYNHEPFIRQAIEGVMMQKTDFEFELVIGEDCSSDRTREICFEYQKRYPSRIRVLWAEENVSKLGGNSRRCRAHSRGEFLSLCEGDDYWIDPFKLQKQVDAMRLHPNVSFCFSGARILNDDGRFDEWDCSAFHEGVMSSQKYALYSMFGRNPYDLWGGEYFQMTATFFARKSALERAVEMFDIFGWKLKVGDGVFSLGVGLVGDVYYLHDQTAVYRLTNTGMSAANQEQGTVDALLLRIYYFVTFFHLNVEDISDRMRDELIFARYLGQLRSGGRRGGRLYLDSMRKCCDGAGRALLKIDDLSLFLALSSYLVAPYMCATLFLWFRRCFARRKRSVRLENLYEVYCPEFLDESKLSGIGFPSFLEKCWRKILK